MQIVKQSWDKVDGRSEVLGRPVYTEDMLPKNCLHLRLVRSPYAFAKVVSVDASAALALPGVVAVYWHEHFPKHIMTIAAEAYPEGTPYDRYAMEDTARYVGQPVAVVAAEDARTAEAARKLVKVEYEVYEPVLDLETAMDNKSVLHEKEKVFCNMEIGSAPERNIAAELTMQYGDIDEAFAECTEIAQGTYHTQAQAHAMMETHRCFCTLDNREKLVIVGSMQSPFHVARIVIRALGLPPNSVRVVKARTGGAFGGKNSQFFDPIVAFVTLQTRRPCVLTTDRQECFETTTTRHEMIVKTKVGADADGMIRAIKVDVLSNTGAYGDHCIDVLAVSCKNTIPMYNKAKAAHYHGYALYTNKVAAGAFRGFGGPQVTYALESTISQLAEKLGIDPVEMRLKNIIQEGERHPFLAGIKENGQDVPLSSSALQRCIQRGREMIGWDEKYPRRDLGDGRVRGVGMSVAMHGSGIAHWDAVNAEVRLNYDGSYTVFSGASDLGTGGDTILCMMAAEVLHTSIANVNIMVADSDYTPYDKGAYASSTTYVTGNAVRLAAEKLKQLMEDGARKFFELGEDQEIILTEETIGTPDGAHQMTIAEFAAKTVMYSGTGQLVANATWGGKTSPPPFVAGFAEVEVDTKTGDVKVIDYAAVGDCGTVINPKLARIQMEGGITQGTGQTLYEAVQYDENGAMLSNDFMKYKVPCEVDIGRIQVAFEESYEPSGPYGAKSLGEVVVHTPMGTITDAIYNAVGVWMKDLPITPEKVLRALKEKEGQK